MRSFSINIFMIAILWARVALGSECANLGHKTKLGDADLIFTQNGCQSWTSQQYWKGEPLGKAVTTAFSKAWKIHSVDDEYEKSTWKNRWYWSNDKQKIIHDFEHETYDKTRKVDAFGAESAVYSDEGDAVLRKGYSFNRREYENGSVDLESKDIEERLKK